MYLGLLLLYLALFGYLFTGIKIHTHTQTYYITTFWGPDLGLPDEDIFHPTNIYHVSTTLCQAPNKIQCKQDGLSPHFTELTLWCASPRLYLV